MRRLFALISAEGKSKEQLKDELWDAFQRYKKSEEKVEDDLMVDVTEQEEAKGVAYQIMGIPKPKNEK